MKRVLFVDDEPRILEGLRRMLRSQRKVWDMEFVTSGPEALEALKTGPFDVLVTDMLMPGMDGANLLKEVQLQCPRTVRIVLSGHADTEAAIRAVAVSHQFISKPCDPDVLREVVDRASNLTHLLQDPVLQSVVGELDELPVLPRIYHALTQALAEPEVDLRQVSRIVEQDPAIVVKILQIVNSSYFGVRREITDAHQATSYLGVSTLRDLVLSVEVFRQFENPGSTQGFSLEKEQAHSLRTARIVRQMFSSKKQSDLAFLAGMLHDIGKLVLASRLPERLGEVLAVCAETQRPPHLVEAEILGVSHAEIGAYLLGLWGMPYSVVEAVAYHHRPGQVTEQTDFGILPAVHVADAFARRVFDDATDWSGDLDLELLERLGVSDRLDSWSATAREGEDPDPESFGEHQRNDEETRGEPCPQ